MAIFFALVFFVASIGTLIFLIKPSLTQFKSKAALSRGKILIYGLAVCLVSLAMVGIFAPEVENKEVQAAAPAAESNTQPQAAEKEVLPVKTEANLGMTPEQFRKKFNTKLKELDIDSIRPVAEFDIKDGSVRDTFQIMFTQDVGLTGTVNKDGSLRELIFTVGGTKEYEKAMMDLLILSGITAQVISPGTEAGNELVKLITAALKNIGKEENTHEKVIGDVEYYALASEVTGLWVGVSPAGE